jgi:hypothetical protein
MSQASPEPHEAPIVHTQQDHNFLPRLPHRSCCNRAVPMVGRRWHRAEKIQWEARRQPFELSGGAPDRGQVPCYGVRPGMRAASGNQRAARRRIRRSSSSGRSPAPSRTSSRWRPPALRGGPLSGKKAGSDAGCRREEGRAGVGVGAASRAAAGMKAEREPGSGGERRAGSRR